MTIEYRVVPLELLRRFTVSVDAHGYGFDGYEDICAILEAPMPPAGGEPEVLALFEQVIGTDPQAFLAEGATVYQVTQAEVIAFAAAHVTRLQAEVDTLKQQVEWRGEMAASNERQYTEQLGKVITLQSELTKARELLNWAEHALCEHSFGNSGEVIEHDQLFRDVIRGKIIAAASHQSAPAAKPEPTMAEQHGMSPEEWAEFMAWSEVMKSAPAAKGGE